MDKNVSHDPIGRLVALHAESIRSDEHGFAKALMGGLIALLVAILFFAAVIGSIQTGVTNAQDNVTDPGAQALLGILVLLTVVAVVVAVVGWALGGLD